MVKCNEKITRRLTFKEQNALWNLSKNEAERKSIVRRATGKVIKASLAITDAIHEIIPLACLVNIVYEYSDLFDRDAFEEELYLQLTSFSFYLQNNELKNRLETQLKQTHPVVKGFLQERFEKDPRYFTMSWQDCNRSGCYSYLATKCKCNRPLYSADVYTKAEQYHATKLYMKRKRQRRLLKY